MTIHKSYPKACREDQPSPPHAFFQLSSPPSLPITPIAPIIPINPIIPIPPIILITPILPILSSQGFDKNHHEYFQNKVCIFHKMSLNLRC